MILTEPDLLEIPSSLRQRLYLPSYLSTEAAQLVGIPARTIARWYYGYQTHGYKAKPVFREGKIRGVPLSYFQLIEVAVVGSCREAGVSLRAIKAAHDYLQRVFMLEYPFARLRLKTDGANILAQLRDSDPEATSLIVANKGGQMIWKDFILRRLLEFDYQFDFVIRWHPRGRDYPVVVDPTIGFGAPTLDRSGLPTWVIKERIEAGETVADIRDDFDVSVDEIIIAADFEGVAHLLPAA